MSDSYSYLETLVNSIHAHADAACPVTHELYRDKMLPPMANEYAKDILRSATRLYNLIIEARAAGTGY